MATITRTLYETCEDLLIGYTPLATRHEGGHIRSMVLRDDRRFWILSQDLDAGTCHLFPWRSGERPAVISFDDDSRAARPAVAAVVKNAVPVPQDGIVFGWVGAGDRVTTLIAVDVAYTPGNPVPTFTVMPNEYAPRQGWPPFYNAAVFGPEMWEAQRAGQLVSVGDAIAGTDRNVYWIERTDGRGAGYCDVGVDVAWHGFTIPAGRYAGWRQMMLRSHRWPSPTDLLDNYTVTDLAPHLR